MYCVYLCVSLEAHLEQIVVLKKQDKITNFLLKYSEQRLLQIVLFAAIPLPVSVVVDINWLFFEFFY